MREKENLIAYADRSFLFPFNRKSYIQVKQLYDNWLLTGLVLYILLKILNLSTQKHALFL